MRTHGWGGSTPATDEEAIERILDAADEVIDVKAEDEEFHVAKVARALGISRTTIYKYFPGTGALIEAVAVRSAVRFADRITEHVAGVTDPVEALLESLAFSIESLAEEKGIQLLFSYDFSRASEQITSRSSIDYIGEMFGRFDVDWAAYGMDAHALAEIAGYQLRLMELLMVHPGRARKGDDLRAFVRRWVGPVFRSEVETHRDRAHAVKQLRDNIHNAHDQPRRRTTRTASR